MTEKASIFQDQTDPEKSMENPQIKCRSPFARLIRKHRYGKFAPWRPRRRKKQVKETPKLPVDELKSSDEQENVENRILEIKSGGYITSRNEDLKNFSNLWMSKSATPLTSPAMGQRTHVECYTSAHMEHREQACELSSRISNYTDDTDDNDSDDENQQFCVMPTSCEMMFSDKRFKNRCNSSTCQLDRNTENLADDHALSNLSMGTQLSLPITDGMVMHASLGSEDDKALHASLGSEDDKALHAPLGSEDDKSLHASLDSEDDKALYLSLDAEEDTPKLASYFSVEEANPSFIIEEDGQVTEIKKGSSVYSPRHQILTNTSYEQARENFLTSITSKATHDSYENIVTDYLGTSPIIKELILETNNDCVLETRHRNNGSRHSVATYLPLRHLPAETDDEVRGSKSGKVAELFKKISLTRTFRSPSFKKEKSQILECQLFEEEKRRNCERVEDLISSLLSIPENITSSSLTSLRKKSHNFSSLDDVREEVENLEDTERKDEKRSEYVDKTGGKKKGNKIFRFFRRIRRRLKRKT